MSDEKWKSPTGHPISSSETDKTEELTCLACGYKDSNGDGRCFVAMPIDNHICENCVKLSKKMIDKHYGVKKSDTVSVDDLMTSVSQCDSANYCYGWNDAIDHLRAKYPNGVKWRQ